MREKNTACNFSEMAFSKMRTALALLLGLALSIGCGLAATSPSTVIVQQWETTQDISSNVGSSTYLSVLAYTASGGTITVSAQWSPTGQGYPTGPGINPNPTLYAGTPGLLQLDINGDGKPDLVQQWNNPDGTLWLLPYIFDGSTFSHGNWITTGQPYETGPAGGPGLLAMDVDGDGKADLVQQWNNNGTLYLLIYHSTGTGLTTGQWINTGQPFNSNPDGNPDLLALDINGDGKIDLVQQSKGIFDPAKQQYTNTDTLYLLPYVSNGTTFSPTNWINTQNGYTSAQGGTPGLIALDINGDGKTDLVQQQNNPSTGYKLSLLPYFSSGTTFTPGAWLDTNQTYATGPGNTPGLIALDINGDGKMDLVQQIKNGNGNLALLPYVSTGTTFAVGSSWDTGQTYASGPNLTPGLFPMDVNGDGKIDLVQQARGFSGNANFFLLTYLSNGTTFTSGPVITTGNGFGSAQNATMPDLLAGYYLNPLAWTYPIGGFVYSGSNVVSGISVQVSNVFGGAVLQTTTTAWGGEFSFELPASGYYVVTPSLAGYTFSPPSMAFYDLMGPETANFTISDLSPATPGKEYIYFGSQLVAIENPNSAPSGPVSVTTNTSLTATSGVPLLTGYNPGKLRNNYSGYVGMELTVGPTALSVNSLGRVYVSGNNQTHTVKLVQASNGADVAGGSVSINMSSGTSGQFLYASLPSPVILNPKTSYYLMSLESAGGDYWYDLSSVIDRGTDASVPAAAFGTSPYNATGAANISYVPVNLLYSLVQTAPAPAAPAVSITAPSAGATVTASTLTLTASATPASGLTIASLQFKIDGTNIGSPVSSSPYTTSVSVSSLSNGTHALTATATDSSGNTGASASVSFTLSQTQAPPSVSVTSPSPNATISGSATTITASASAASGLTIASVQFKIDGTNTGGLLSTSPYSITFNTQPLSNGTHALTAVATDSSGNSATSPSVSVTVSNSTAPAPVALLSGFNAASLRNNFPGFVGMQITVGSSAVNVTSLGRLYVSGNSGAHQIKLVVASTGADVPNGSVSVAFPSGTPGQFTYVALTSPVSLAANTSYYLVSQEASGGDQWYDNMPVTSGGSAIAITAPVYYGGGSYQVVPNTPNYSFVPVNLLYTATSQSAPTVSVTAPAAGASVSGSNVTLTANAAPASGLSIARVQFQLNGVNVGTSLTAFPYTTTFNSSTYANASYSLTAIATDSAGTIATSAPITINVNNNSSSNASTAPLLSGFSGGPLRNNYSGWVGMQLKVGSSNITVTSVGRIYVNGNSASHVVKLVDSNGADLAGGSAAVALPSGSAGQFAYKALATPVTLIANSTYYLVSQETANGDNWYDIGTVTAAGVASVLAPVYTDAQGAYYPVSGYASQSYVPVNFLYQSGTAIPPTASVTAPASGTTVSANITLSATASATSGLTVASLQFQIDGVNKGNAVTVSPYSTGVDTTTLSNGSHTVTVVVTDSANNAATSSPISFNVNNSNTSDIPLITSFTQGPSRNNFTGFVGMAINVGSAPINVTSLGRIYIPGMQQTHIVKLVNADGTDIPNANVSVSSASPVTGQFAYVSLPATIQLAANKTYYLVSQEAASGDYWYDVMPVVPTSVANITGPVYVTTSTYSTYNVVGGSTNYSYIPVNLLYH